MSSGCNCRDGCIDAHIPSPGAPATPAPSPRTIRDQVQVNVLDAHLE
jgi:hypothetical protein